MFTIRRSRWQQQQCKWTESKEKMFCFRLYFMHDNNSSISIFFLFFKNLINNYIWKHFSKTNGDRICCFFFHFFDRFYFKRTKKRSHTKQTHGENGEKRKQNRNKYITSTKVTRTLFPFSFVLFFFFFVVDVVIVIRRFIVGRKRKTKTKMIQWKWQLMNERNHFYLKLKMNKFHHSFFFFERRKKTYGKTKENSFFPLVHTIKTETYAKMNFLFPSAWIKWERSARGIFVCTFFWLFFFLFKCCCLVEWIKKNYEN